MRSDYIDRSCAQVSDVPRRRRRFNQCLAQPFWTALTLRRQSSDYASIADQLPHHCSLCLSPTPRKNSTIDMITLNESTSGLGDAIHSTVRGSHCGVCLTMYWPGQSAGAVECELEEDARLIPQTGTQAARRLSLHGSWESSKCICTTVQCSMRPH